MIKSLKDLLDKFSRFTNSLVYDGGICKRLLKIHILIRLIFLGVVKRSLKIGNKVIRNFLFWSFVK